MILSRIGGDDAAEEACDDKFRRSVPARLDQIINLKHALAQLAEKLDWDWIDGEIAPLYSRPARAPGGQFVLHAKALPDNPYDGHTLRDAIEDTQKLTGCEIERAYVDKVYRGHDAQNPRRVVISGQKRRVFGAIKRELRRRSAIEPVIGHMKSEGHLGRCYLNWCHARRMARPRAAFFEGMDQPRRSGFLRRRSRSRFISRGRRKVRAMQQRVGSIPLPFAHFAGGALK